MKKHIITIAGLTGSGKSSTARGVAEALGYEHFSSGDLFRKMAAERGLTVEELNYAAEKQVQIDRKVDELLAKLGREKNSLVIDSRMAFHWIPDSFKVFLDLDPGTAAERTLANILKEGRLSQVGASIDEVRGNSAKRTISEKKRYESLYHVDVADKTQFDLVIDTANKTITDVIKQVIKAYQEWLNGSH